MAKKIQTRNKELNGSGDIVPVFLSGYAELDDEVIEGLDAKIYMFDLEDERTLLNAYFRIRKRHPEALCFCNCGPDELPVLAYAGFDIFPETEENKAALERLMLERSPQYIEMMACSSIRSKTLLDLLYHAHWAEFEPFLATPRNRELYISRDAFWRPNTQKWVEDIKEGYMPQSNVFLLLPCSSRKPYSSSQSHRSFISLTRSVLGKGYASLCQLIITSPYGVVPRDLESLIDYDIVVTGKWLPEEISRSRDVLSSIISKTDNPVVIAHLPENELETIKELEADVIVTTRGHPLSEESMRNLKETLESVKGDLPPPKDRYGDIRRFSEHIYGKDIFPESIYVKGKGIRQVFSEGVPFASLIWGIRPTNGDIEVSKKYVDIENFELKGDLFCVGVREAEDGIRAGDEVVIRND
ncbi:MAG TPA: DUF5591 domain-containing protein, partial [Candidatus Methanofastidiosa archaeon]|nr:DUF5591 domain-containing protein [Candidatus Methanofastidiosa archaeon]